MVAGALRRRGVALHACRLGHGLKKLTAGTVLLRAGLVLAPLDYRAVPAAWLDGVVDAFQEDYCTSCTFSPASAIFGYSCSRPCIPSASRAAA